MGKKFHLEPNSKTKEATYIEKIYDKNGNLMMVKSAKDNYYNIDCDPRTLMLSEHKLYEPYSIEFYNPDGSFNKCVLVKSGHKDQYISMWDKDGEANLQEHLKQNVSSYYGGIDGDNVSFNIEQGNIKLNKNEAEGLSKDELKQQIEKTANNLEEAFGIMQKEGMPYLQGSDSIFNKNVHIDVTTIIEQMRNFIKSL